jgi:hypothetical protein
MLTSGVKQGSLAFGFMVTSSRMTERRNGVHSQNAAAILAVFTSYPPPASAHSDLMLIERGSHFQTSRAS